MIIYLGGDHRGFELKEEIKQWLTKQGFQVEDLGAFAMDPTDDYPDFVIPVAKAVALHFVQAFGSKAQARRGKNDARGIVFGATGQGEAIATNKIKGIRAALYYGGSLEIVKRSRSHNNANVLSLGARFLTPEEAIDAVQLWLETPFEGGRHERRLKKIEVLE